MMFHEPNFLIYLSDLLKMSDIDLNMAILYYTLWYTEFILHQMF